MASPRVPGRRQAARGCRAATWSAGAAAGGRVGLGGDAGGDLLAEADVATEAGQVLVAGLGLEFGAVRPSAARSWSAEWRSWCREPASIHLAGLGRTLDVAWRGLATGLAEPRQADGTPQVRLEPDADGKIRIRVSPLEAVPEPPSLVALRGLIARMLPRADLPELLLQVDAWTGFTSEFTHLAESGSRMEDLAVSACAVARLLNGLASQEGAGAILPACGAPRGPHAPAGSGTPATTRQRTPASRQPAPARQILRAT